MPSDAEEWKAHFESLDNKVLLDLLASPSLLHRSLVEEIVLSRGLSRNDVSRLVQQRQDITEQSVQESKITGDYWHGATPDLQSIIMTHTILMFIAGVLITLILVVITWNLYGASSGVITLSIGLVISIIFPSAIANKTASKEYVKRINKLGPHDR